MLQELAGHVPLDDMETSVIMSARQGVFTKPERFMFRQESSLLDLSAMLAQPEKQRKSKLDSLFEATASSQVHSKGNFNRLINSRN